MDFKKYLPPIRTDEIEKYESLSMRTVRKLNCFTTLHAGFFVCFVYVPFVFSATDAESTHLTYADVYKYTEDQIQNSRSPYNASHSPYQSNSTNTKENDVEVYRFKDIGINGKEQLLVGFARDPFRLSVPEADYLNGVREIDPKQYSNKERGKRGVVHLYNMLLCTTGCDPLHYQGYGCYCGFLGSGRPRDGIDYCCMLHDQCYERVSCPVFSVYFQPYYWSCYGGEPQCSLKNYRFKSDLVGSCAARLCECDRRLAKCVQQYSCPHRSRRPLCESSPLSLLQNLLSLD